MRYSVKRIGKIRTLALLVLVAFTTNAMLPFLALYGSPSSAGATNFAQNPAQNSAQNSGSQGLGGLFSFFGEKVLICTAGGFRWVSLEELQNSKEQPEPHQQFQCPLCYITAQGISHALSTKAVTLDRLPAIQLRIYRAPAVEIARALLLLSAHPSRAPPFSVIA